MVIKIWEGLKDTSGGGGGGVIIIIDNPSRLC